MRPAPDKQGFTLIEVMAAMLLLSLAYVAILESFSSSMARISTLDRHYTRLVEVEQTLLAEPLFFVGAEAIPEGELYLEGRRYNLISQNSNGVETLLLVQKR